MNLVRISYLVAVLFLAIVVSIQSLMAIVVSIQSIMAILRTTHPGHLRIA